MTLDLRFDILAGKFATALNVGEPRGIHSEIELTFSLFHCLIEHTFISLILLCSH